MRKVFVAGIIAILAGCGQAKDDAAQETPAEAAEREAAIEASKSPPVLPVSPDTMTFADFEKNDIFGAGCSFPASDSNAGSLAVTMSDAAYLKIDGEIMKLAPDVGSDENPLNTYSKYDGREYSLRLTTAEGNGEQVGYETVDFPGRITIYDQYDRAVFDRQGTVQCGS